MRDDYISGKVTEIQPGKDGYTARLVTAGGQVYVATVSRANLKENAAQYRSVAVGDTLRLKGDVWQQVHGQAQKADGAEKHESRDAHGHRDGPRDGKTSDIHSYRALPSRAGAAAPCG